nr:MAG TPA: hypothetical protein [Inoviridae sp.]
MEKKLKINFILKGIAIFAFVSFCLLAILAGVTLPFVSNASTTDSAVASANIVPNSYESYTVSLDACNSTDNYYGFYFTEEFYNYLMGASSLTPDTIMYMLASMVFTDNSSSLLYVGGKLNDDGTSLVNRACYLTYYLSSSGNAMLDSSVPYSISQRVVIFEQGFKVSVVPNDDWHFARYLKVFTVPIPYTEKEVIIYKTNYGFESRFGYIGSLVTSNLYVSLQNNALIPDTLCRIRDSETNELVNGWYITDNNELFLPILNSFDEFGNSVSSAFTGWHLTNISVNGVSSSSYNVYFEVLGQRISRVGVATITNNVVDIEVGSTPEFYVESNISNNENLLVYGIQNLPLKYNLKVNLSNKDFYKFFAFFDYRTYTITNNDYYISGLSTASKGYYDTGYNKGYSVGKDEGYNTGFNAGDAQGYARGVESANTYSFLGLFGAIFDAPIKAIFGGTSTLPAGTTITDSNGNTITLQSTTTVNRAGLLNFNLMGVNLSGFVLALFSISIIVVVIKFALAKK